MVNGEILGYTPRTWVQCTPELLPFMRGVAGDLGGYVQVSEPSTNWTLSDHLCFEMLGVPVAFLLPARDLGTHRRSPWWKVYHTERDNLETINPVALESNARLLALLALRLDAVQRLPYSLENLVAAASREIESLANSKRLRGLLAERKGYCEKAEGEEKLRRTLEFIRAVDRNIYAFNRPFGQKFEMMVERIARLRDAYYILKMDGDLNRAREVLFTLADFSAAAYFSGGVVAEVGRRRAETPLMRDLGVLEMDWSQLVDCLSRADSVEDILSALEGKIEEAQELAGAWGKRLEEALAFRSL
jgi:hypothetical protein